MSNATLKIQVLCALLETGATALAAETGIERTAVHKVLAGTRNNPRVRDQLAELLGEKVKSLILTHAEANGQTEIDHGQGSRGVDGAVDSNNTRAKSRNGHNRPREDRSKLVVRGNVG